MGNHAMDYEHIVSRTFNGGISRYSDMLAIGDADIWQNETGGFATNNNHYPMGVIIGLGASYKRVQKLAGEGDVYNAMAALYERLRKAKSYEDYCKLVDATVEAYDSHKIYDLVYNSK